MSASKNTNSKNTNATAKNVSENREENTMNTTAIRQNFGTDEAIRFAKNTMESRKENNMDIMNIVANPCFSLKENKKLNGMELTFRGYLSLEQFTDLRNMGWNYSSKFNKPYGKYWAAFNANLWNDTAELIKGNWLTVLAEKPAPVKDYSHKPVLTQQSRQLLTLTGTRHFSSELHDQLCNIGWSYSQKTNTYTFRCTKSCKRMIVKTQELLKDKKLECKLLDEPAPKSKAKAKADDGAQLAMMGFTPVVVEDSADDDDFYAIFK